MALLLRAVFCVFPVAMGANLVPALPVKQDVWHALSRLFLVARGCEAGSSLRSSWGSLHDGRLQCWQPGRRLTLFRDRCRTRLAAKQTQPSRPSLHRFSLLVPPLCFLVPPRLFVALQTACAAIAVFHVRHDCGCCYLQLPHARAELERWAAVRVVTPQPLPAIACFCRVGRCASAQSVCLLASSARRQSFGLTPAPQLEFSTLPLRSPDTPAPNLLQPQGEPLAGHLRLDSPHHAAARAAAAVL